VFAKSHAVAISLAIAAIVPMGCKSGTGGPDGGPDGGGPDGGGPDGGVPDGGGGPGIDGGASVLQYHNHPSRDGVYFDAALTKTAVAGMHQDPAFIAPILGPTYAQPLYLDNGPAGGDLIFAVTEKNIVYALNPATGSVVRQRTLGAPVPLTQLPCGNLDPLGITGTPIIDLESRTLFVDAMTTPDSGATLKHLVFGLSIDDLSTRPGWPVDVSAAVTGPVSFNSPTQNQRGGLALLNRTLYVPYGSHYGGCGPYYGWVVGFPLANPSSVTAWHSQHQGAGVWAPSGVATDGSSLFIATGDIFLAPLESLPNTWQNTEAVIRLTSDVSFSGLATDYFTPTNWLDLDYSNLDLGSTGPVLFTLNAPSPTTFTFAVGKTGKAYLLNAYNLGGVSEGVTSATAANSEVVTAAAVYTTAQGTYIAYRGDGGPCPAGNSGDLAAVKVSANPPSITTAWCVYQNGAWFADKGGSPIVTMTSDHTNVIVWNVGGENPTTGQGDNYLRGFDGDTGEMVFNGGGPSQVMHLVRRFQTPIVAKGRIYVAADDRIYSFRP
jgi:hypothetical protein